MRCSPGPTAVPEHWATVASLIETCKLNTVDPLAYLTDVLTRIDNGHLNRNIDALLPWSYRQDCVSAPNSDPYRRPTLVLTHI